MAEKRQALCDILRRKWLLGNMDFLWSSTFLSSLAAVVQVFNWMFDCFHLLLTAGKHESLQMIHSG